MVEYDLDDLGVPVKTENTPRDGVKKGDKILHKFDEDYNPVSAQVSHSKIKTTLVWLYASKISMICWS